MLLTDAIISLKHVIKRQDIDEYPHSSPSGTRSLFISTSILTMLAAGITEATIPIALSGLFTMPTTDTSRGTHIYHRGGIIGRVESLIYGA